MIEFKPCGMPEPIQISENLFVEIVGRISGKARIAAVDQASAHCKTEHPCDLDVLLAIGRHESNILWHNISAKNNWRVIYWPTNDRNIDCYKYVGSGSSQEHVLCEYVTAHMSDQELQKIKSELAEKVGEMNEIEAFVCHVLRKKDDGKLYYIVYSETDSSLDIQHQNSGH